ncbi:MAG: Xaa-Pro dipeptidase [Gammaproteobacteria bacterium]
MASASRLYAAHIKSLCQRYDRALEASGFDSVLIGAGQAPPVYRDDQHYPYRAEALFLQWAPLLAHPGSALLYRPGRKPLLLVLEPVDYWHQPAPIPQGPWQRRLDIRVLRKPGDLRRHLPRNTLALLGDPGQWRGLEISGHRNPRPLLTYLDYERACKTSWEVHCIEQATVQALAGHRAVQTAFQAGLSEFEMGLMFLAGCGQSDAELPYPAIVAMNENGATLHYQHRNRQRLPARERHSLLLDAGSSVAGYASDITRTHAARRGEFATMVRDMDRTQQGLCAQVKPGVAFPDLQLGAFTALAELLARWELVRMSPADMVKRRIVDSFMPHGLGHLLGLQVHDVGGNLASPGGRKLAPPVRFPRLRLTRSLEPGMVVTIEPGIYFIDPLLARLKKSRHHRQVNWKKLRDLRRYGGIRIEDNVLVTADGHRNLTREAQNR